MTYNALLPAHSVFYKIVSFLTLPYKSYGAGVSIGARMPRRSFQDIIIGYISVLFSGTIRSY